MISIRDSYRLPGHVRVVPALLLVNLISFLASRYATHGLYGLSDMIFMGGVLPAEYHHPELLADIEPYRAALRLNGFIPLIWHQLLHGGWMHLLSNMLVLAVFGPNVERYMGHRRFLLFYLTCGCFGAMLEVLFHLDSLRYVIGGSGAATGLFGAYLRVFPTNDLRITLGNMRSGAYRDIMLPVKAVLVIWAAGQLMDALIPRPGAVNSVAYLTHLGGFAAGYMLARGRGSFQAARRNFKVFMGGRAGGGGR